MDRVCVRPGCDRPARARLAYDTVTCQVWLDQLLDRSGRAQEICELHAERLTVPRGWMLCDRRAEAPALFVAEVAAPVDARDAAGAEAPARRRRRSRRDADDTRNLFDEIAADISEAPIEVVMAPHLAVVGPAVVGPAVVDPAVVEPELVPDAAPESGPVSEPMSEPEAPAAAAAATVPDEADELSVLKATSPLLARAFSQTGPQRSVLTQSNGDDATD